MSAKVRLGFITPSSNTALEPAISALVQGHASAHFARVRVTRIGLDDSSDDQFDSGSMEGAAELLADARPAALAWAGTSGSWLGVDRDRELCRRLTAATGVPATSSTLAVLAACDAYGARRLGLVSPYTAEVSERIAKELDHNGFDVTSQQYRGLSDNFEFADTGTPELTEMVRHAADGADAVIVLCTNVDGVAVAARAGAEIGLPVFDSIAATVWHTMAVAGHQLRLPEAGELLTHGTLRARMQHVVERLRDATLADRTTLRVDLPAAGLSVSTCAAESCGRTVTSIRADASLPQRELETVRWLETHRVALVQPDFAVAPYPPRALSDIYGVRAQMLTPVVLGSVMAGWLSVHSITERPWSDDDCRALDAAGREVTALLDTNRQLGGEVT